MGLYIAVTAHMMLNIADALPEMKMNPKMNIAVIVPPHLLIRPIKQMKITSALHY